MNQKQLLWLSFATFAAFVVGSIIWMNAVMAQQPGEGGFGAAGAAGGAGAAGEGGLGGEGGAGGRGGAGGGGGGYFAPSTSGGGIAAHGEYVYVLRHSQLYQYAAYDLALVKKISLSKAGKKQNARNGGAGGRGGAGGAGGGNGGQGGDGGAFAYMAGGGGASEGVAAYGEFVYVLEGNTLRKLSADGLTSVKKVKLKFDE